MRKFEGSISTNKVGSGCSFVFEVEDDASQETIESEARQAAFDNIDWSFKEVSSDEAKLRMFTGIIASNKIGSECEFEFSVEADASQEEIESEAKEAAFEEIEWSFVEVKI